MECRCRHNLGPEVSSLGLGPDFLAFSLCDMGYATQFPISVTDLLLKRNKSVKVFCKTLTFLSLPAHYSGTNGLEFQVHCAFFKQLSQISCLAFVLSGTQTPGFGCPSF